MPVPDPITKTDETLDRICSVLDVLQAKKGYRFGIESLLLAWFVEPNASNLADLGCGSGIIAMLAACFRQANQVVGVEVQPALADRARRSVVHNQLADKVQIIEADLRNLNEILPAGGFEVVTANPPFRPANTGSISDHPEKALGKHEITCSLSDVVASAARLLKSRGRFNVVLPPERLCELLAHCATYKLNPNRLRMIHGRIELRAKNCLLEAVLSGKGALRVEPPLILYKSSGQYTEEVQQILHPKEGSDGQPQGLPLHEAKT